jgi:YHS domain-containing protein
MKRTANAAVVLMMSAFMAAASADAGCGSCGPSECKVDLSQTQEAAQAVVKPVNTICPVTGGKIDENTAFRVEYGGKVVGFCCADCIPDFNKDPEKYMKKVEEELAAAAEKKE